MQTQLKHLHKTLIVVSSPRTHFSLLTEIVGALPPFHNYLESLPELVGDNVVEQRVNSSRDVVQDPTDVRHDAESCYHVRGGGRTVYCQESLGVKWGPANEERHDDRHCNKKKTQKVQFD